MDTDRGASMKYLPALLLLLMIPLAAGCGAAADDTPDVASAGTSSTKTEPAAAKKPKSKKDMDAAMLAHARCMRKNGIDVPDPKPGQGERITIKEGADDTKLKAAMKACEGIMEDAGVKPSKEELDKQFGLALAFAKCMREHGIDMPDPQRDGDGIKMSMGGPGSSIDPTRMDEAQKACAKDAPFGDGPPPSDLGPGEGVISPAGGSTP
jgi:pyruvate/2-oxoglutarate dehydrogenase complex dihydrolipoamide acyltransferase (E2) component